jgi:signal transduction histidine kinase
MKDRARAASYALSILAIVTVCCGIELMVKRFFYPDNEILDIVGDIVSALLFARCKQFFDRVTERIFSRGSRDVSGELLTNISHELQTPIAILRGNVELLQKRCITEAERVAAERVVVATLDGMSRMIGGVLESAKLKFSKNVVHRQEVEIKELLEETREDILLLAEDRHISIAACADPHISLSADRGKLKEVLLNLISNALKHTPRGGTIVLRAKRAGFTARIVVEDSGYGIAPEALPHIFERFYHITSGAMSLADSGAPAAAPVPSTGIGLNICREIIEAHGGKIMAESDVGRGSRFIISLPMPRRRAVVAARAIRAASAIINQ